MIYFAVDDEGVALATCMAKPMEGDTWEICKLGSNKNVPHKGAGSAVFEASMKWATDHGAGRLFIISNICRAEVGALYRNLADRIRTIP